MKRLLTATFVALAAMWLLGFLASFVTTRGAASSISAFTHLDPLNLLMTSIAMCLGGFIEGKRFIAVALAIVCVLWIGIVIALVQMAKPADALPYILAYNRMHIALSLPAACAGAAIGAWLHMKRDQSRGDMNPYPGA
jgi:hypothetical protein